MAKAKTATQDTTVDDLLNGGEETQTVENAAPAQTDEEKAKIEEEIKALQAKVKELKSLAKGEKPKKERVLKGRMVAFKNKAGEQIVGLGQLYYVARAGGKLHYKEASQVVTLPEDWKDGDPIPELPAQEEETKGE